MTDPSNPALTTIEFAVLARLSQPAGADPETATELRKAVNVLKLTGDAPLTTYEVTGALDVLCQRELAATVPSKSTPRTKRWAITDRGARTLRETLKLPRTPMWKALCDRYLPALELGLTSHGDPNLAEPGKKSAISAQIVATRLHVRPPTSVAALCDALIVDELKLPAGTRPTLTSIRIWALNQRLRRENVEVRDTPKTAKDLDQSIRKIAARILNVKSADRKLFLGKLRIQALHKITKRSQSNGHARPTEATPPMRDDQTLLTAVQDAIPRIGADGRHGPEKVFVSAIWRTLERDHQFWELSIDKFKRWLVDANRRRVLDLARADFVSAMDGTLVAESEIRDFGATFHFVLDRQAHLPGSDKGFHARKA